MALKRIGTLKKAFQKDRNPSKRLLKKDRSPLKRPFHRNIQFKFTSPGKKNCFCGECFFLKGAVGFSLKRWVC